MKMSLKAARLIAIKYVLANDKALKQVRRVKDLSLINVTWTVARAKKLLASLKEGPVREAFMILVAGKRLESGGLFISTAVRNKGEVITSWTTFYKWLVEGVPGWKWVSFKQALDALSSKAKKLLSSLTAILYVAQGHAYCYFKGEWLDSEEYVFKTFEDSALPKV